jgi:hypothetical protein
MINDEELNAKIEKVCEEFTGQLDDLYAAVGMVVVGRRYGWRVMRLVAPRRHWTVATRLFGDPKQLMRERGRLYSKSVGCSLIDKAGDYWGIISGRKEQLPLDVRKAAM